MATSSVLAQPVRLLGDVPAPMRLWHLTSLDAPTIAVTWALAFAWAAGVRLPLEMVAGLGLAAWAFYIADRLLDARSGRGELRLRHHFHWHHRRWLLPVAVASAVAALLLCLSSMPASARSADSLLTVAALAYFGSVHGVRSLRPSSSRLYEDRRKSRLPKELLVALVFTAACFAPAWAFMASFPIELLAGVACFAALAWLNCWGIEVWESGDGCAENRLPSIALPGMLLCGFALLAATIAGVQGQWRYAVLLAMAAVSGALLAMLHRLREHLTATGLRVMADAVLLTPMIVLAMR